MLSKVYKWTFEYIVEERMTVLWLYYDWAVYDIRFDIYLKSLSLGG